MKMTLSDGVIPQLAPPKKRGSVFLRDDVVQGLAVRVSNTGWRAFVLSYSSRYRRGRPAREHRIVIGRWPEWSVDQAREEARALRRRIDQGEDPAAQRRRRPLRGPRGLRPGWCRVRYEERRNRNQ